MDRFRIGHLVTGAIATITSISAGVTVAITNQSISKSIKITISPAVASYSINSSGNVVNQNGTILEAWLTGGTSSNYDVMVTPISGVALTGTTGSWLNGGSNQTWSISNSAGDDSTISSQFTVQIRLSATGVVQASATITLNATSRSPIGGGGP